MTYQERVLKLEAEGLCTSDAQAVVDAEIQKDKERGMEIVKWVLANTELANPEWVPGTLRKVAQHFNGSLESTGGGVEVVLIQIEPGLVVGVGDESICLYRGDPSRAAYDIFWDGDQEADCYCLWSIGE